MSSGPEANNVVGAREAREIGAQSLTAEAPTVAALLWRSKRPLGELRNVGLFYRILAVAIDAPGLTPASLD